MTVLLYDYCELEERAARHLRTWKAWHLILFSLAAIFGVANYIILQQAMQLVDDNCVLYPRLLEFRTIPRPNATAIETYINYTAEEFETTTVNNELNDEKNDGSAQDTVSDEKVTEKSVVKREIPDNYTTMEVANMTVITGNLTHQTVVDTSRSLFALEGDCQFAEYMPVMSTVGALVWITLFTMCQGGGRARSGLQQPWRILTPALVFAAVLVGLTGHSFSRTNGGIQAFCAAFVNITGTTKCSAVDPFLEKSWYTSSWGFGARSSAARAASAAVWAAWACAAALLLARCLAAPDFVVRRTGVYLKDPHGKITPHLRKSRRKPRSPVTPVSRRDNASLASEPTFTTELETAAVEPGQDTAPTSLMATPVRKDHGERGGDLIEMTYSPQERN